MATKRTIHVVGTGTIGEPLLGLLLHTQQALEVDEITFHKHSPRLAWIPMNPTAPNISP